jgi:HEAT repeat protein
MAGAIIQITILLSGLVAADAGAPSKDHPNTPTRVEVESALAKDGGPRALQHWAATADGILTSVAADRATAETVRARALSALAYAKTSRVHAFLENFIIEKTPSSAPVDRVLLRRAATSLGWQGGGRVVEVVAPLLDNGDADVRLDAAAALGLARARDAERPLRARLAVEADPAVRRQIEAALKAVTAAR